MSQSPLVLQWQKKFSDPYALLGISVTADERRISKRYRQVAKLLHPDSYQARAADRDLAKDVFAQLISPAHHQLSQPKGRSEMLALLRLRVRSLINKQGGLYPVSEQATRLLNLPSAEVDVFYEQAIVTLAEVQYQVLEQFEQITEQLLELNRAYLYIKHIKSDAPVVREQRTGLIAAATAKPMQLIPVSQPQESPTENYAKRHCERAREYMKKGVWLQAIQELRDAIKLEANQSEYHSLLGLAYLKQNLTGMATVHFRQALKLNPKDELALKYAPQLKIPLPTQSNRTGQSTKRGGLFGLFGGKR